jgi:hypothetical protein
MMKKLISIALLLVLMGGCSADWHVRRALKKNPLLLQKDTLRVNDTIVTESISHDTMLHFNTLFDTIRIDKERLSVRIVRVNDSIYVRGECKSDTIYRTIEVPIEKIVYSQKERFKDKVKRYIGALPIVALLLFILYLLLNWRKK